jgi:hypothetical protein
MTSTTKKQNGTITGGTTGQVTTKSGKGANHGVVTELSAYFTVKPGHENELRAAALQFGGMLLKSDPNDVQRTGLRDARFVIFDDGRQLLFGSSFETDWDPYIDDAIDVVGVEHFVDWMQHTVEAEILVAYIESLGGVKKFGKNDPAYDENLKRTSAKVKEVIQSVQTPAAAYFNALSSLTIPQIKKAQHVNEAFQRVLDNPAAQEALQHPALKPLLEQAAD